MPTINDVVETLMGEVLQIKAGMYPGYTNRELRGITYELGISDDLTRAFLVAYSNISVYEEIVQITGLDDKNLRSKLQDFIILIESKREVHND